jgi:protein-arginine kinase activator protein McsA
MLCPHCKKNQASQSYRRIKNGKEEVEYYCLTCYERKIERAVKMETVLACPYCGTTAEEAKKRNIVGCAMCYGALREV